MTTQVWLGGSNNSNLATSGTQYVPFWGHGDPITTTLSPVPAPCGGTITNLSVTLGTAPGAGTSRTFTLMVNGSTSTLTVTISDTATSASDSTHTVSFSAGDTLALRSTVSGTPAAGTVLCAAKTDTTNANDAIMWSHGILVQSTGTNYTPPTCGINTDIDTAVNQKHGPWPLAVTVTAIYVQVVNGGGGSNNGLGWTHSLVQNSSNVAATAVTTTVSGGNNPSGNATGLSVSVSAADLLAFRATGSSIALSGTNRAGYGVCYTTSGGGYGFVGNIASNPSTTVTRYWGINSPNTDSLTSAQGTFGLKIGLDTLVVTGAYVHLNGTGPVVGHTWTVAVVKGGSATAVAPTVAGAATTGSDLSHTATFSTGDLIELSIAPSDAGISNGSNPQVGVLLVASVSATTSATGSSATVSAGTLTPGQSLALTGSAVTASAGSVGRGAFSITLSGTSVTASAGDLGSTGATNPPAPTTESLYLRGTETEDEITLYPAP